MSLATYLINHDVVTGPLEKNTSYSRLEVIRKFLLCRPQFKGGEKFLKFGSALHEVFLENKFETYNKLSKPEKSKIVAMVNKLNSNPAVMKLMQSSIREEKMYGDLHYANLALILDAKQPKLSRGFDLKTTTCKTQEQFESKMVTYGYVKQAFIYKKIAGLKEFYFVAIRKEEPYSIFIVDTNKWKEEEKYANNELEFLTYFYSRYGKFADGTPTKKITLKKIHSSGDRLFEEMMLELKGWAEDRKVFKALKRKIRAREIFMRRTKKKFRAKDWPMFEDRVMKIIQVLKNNPTI